MLHSSQHFSLSCISISTNFCICTQADQELSVPPSTPNPEIPDPQTDTHATSNPSMKQVCLVGSEGAAIALNTLHTVYTRSAALRLQYHNHNRGQKI